MSGNSQNRWWEFYFIRYAVGTICGAIIVLSIANSLGVKWIPFLPISSTGVEVVNCQITSKFIEPICVVTTSEISVIHLIVYGIYGLVFCYISSAPILVFHASRWLYFYVDKPKFLISKVTLLSVIIIFISLLIKLKPSRELEIITLLISSTFLTCTYRSALLSLIKHPELFKTYSHLNKARNNKINAGLIESYRHLREHGNAFFIVLCEVLLGLLLYTIGSYHVGTYQKINLILVILFWITPAALVWKIGSLLERDFVNKNIAPYPIKPSVDKVSTK